jgi:hypothetical protein
MPSCERCWTAAAGDYEVYSHLLSRRNCTPEEQVGTDARACPDCGRKTIHQHCGVCMNPACAVGPPEEYPNPKPKET